MEREKLNEILNKLNNKRQSHPNFCSLWSNYLNIKSHSFLKEINTHVLVPIYHLKKYSEPCFLILKTFCST